MFGFRPYEGRKRSRISAAALFVKVMARMLLAQKPCASSHAMRLVSTRVYRIRHQLR